MGSTVFWLYLISRFELNCCRTGDVYVGNKYLVLSLLYNLEFSEASVSVLLWFRKTLCFQVSLVLSSLSSLRQ